MNKFSLLLSTCLVFGTLGATPPAHAQGVAGAYLAGRSAGIEGDYAAAAKYYTEALARDPGNAALMENVVLAQIALGQIDRAVPVARMLADGGIASQIGNMALISGLAKAGEYDEIQSRIDDKKGIGPLVDGLLAAWSSYGLGDMSGALEGFDAVAADDTLRAFGLYHKALAYAAVGDMESPAELFEAPENGLTMTRRGAIAHIEILSQLEQNEKAIEVMDSSFGADLDPGLADMRARLVAGEMLSFDQVRSAQDGMAEVSYSIGSALNREADQDYILLYARMAEYLRPDHIDAVLMTAGLLESLGRYDLAVQTYAKVPNDSFAFYAAELGRADSLRKSGKVEAAIEVLRGLTRSHPDIPSVHTTLADVMRQEENYQAAIESYDTALSLYDDLKPAQWFILYARAIAKERSGQWDGAEADFRAALELNPDQPQVMNYLGYSLVEKQQKLDEALDLITRAVAAEPDSGYIVDSLGWVQYRLGRYEEAVVNMERAAELMAVDPVVNDHLGDVLWAVGRTLEAEFQWRRALSFITEDSDLDEIKPDRIRRKLEVGLDEVLKEEGAPPLKVANDG